uniref:Uncharacterized protein n=1 Tax=Clastoptera arizonana TaxID=38151 RepID=A0A1B6C0I5_9HEMI
MDSGCHFCIGIILMLIFNDIESLNFSEINLHPDHLPYYFNLFKEIGKQCLEETTCPYKNNVGKPGCWSYVNNCSQNESYSTPSCPGDHKGWVSSKQSQIDTFFMQGDFGYIGEQQNELMVICEPNFAADSSLICSKHLRYCQGRNIKIDFKDLINRKDPIRYKMDVLTQGKIGGFCNLHQSRLDEECDHISPLQSWGPELRYFTSLTKQPAGTSETSECDVVIDKPTYIMKIDASKAPA